MMQPWNCDCYLHSKVVVIVRKNFLKLLVVARDADAATVTKIHHLAPAIPPE
jgi:hypothetical protein